MTAVVIHIYRRRTLYVIGLAALNTAVYRVVWHVGFHTLWSPALGCSMILPGPATDEVTELFA